MTVSPERRAWSRLWLEGMAAGFTEDAAARFATAAMRTTYGRRIVVENHLEDVRARARAYTEHLKTQPWWPRHR